MDIRQEAIQEFESMRNMAELKALSNISLERPLNDSEYNRMIQLKQEVIYNESKNK